MNRPWGLLGAAIGCEVVASLSLKAALERPWFAVPVVLGYLGAFTLLAAVLRRGMPLGVAYGIWGATGVAATAVLASWIYAEPFTVLMAAGIVLIVAGVLTVELGSHTAAEEPA